MLIRRALEPDVAAIISLYSADALTSAREGHQSMVTAEALAAFREIDADPNNEVWVAELDGAIVGTLQLTFIPGLSRGGLRRALVEAMHVHPAHRNRGLGEQLMNNAIARARERGCRLLQLTSDVRRVDAHRFYQRLGLEPSHVGMKLKL